MNRYQQFSIVLTLLAVIALWQIAFSCNWIDRRLLAGPLDVVDEMAGAFLIGGGSTAASPAHPQWLHALEKLGISPHHGSLVFISAGDTFLRAFVGWSLAVVFGLVFGAIISASTSLYRAAEPLLEFVRAAPPVIIFPLLLVVFNFGVQAYVWTIVLGCLPVMLLAVARGSLGIAQERVELLSVFRAHWATRCFARMMEVLPSIVLGARLAFSLSLAITIALEMCFSPRYSYSLGALARDSEIALNTPAFFSCVIVIGIYGYAANFIFKAVENFLRGVE